MELSADELREILKIFVESNLRDLHLEVGDVRLAVSKNEAVAAPRFTRGTAEAAPAPAPTAPAPAPTAPVGVREGGPAAPPSQTSAADASTTASRDGLFEVRSPLVGIFYRRPAPDRPPYVEVGDVIEADAPVCTISVMKMFNEVKAGCAGKVVEILVEDETMVEHGQTLLLIEPSTAG
ncbi:MAG: acetyl-CoA carboxylase biotin carboxyl carrier protein [Candidatus Velamenicoccus archaeovorus]